MKLSNLHLVQSTDEQKKKELEDDSSIFTHSRETVPSEIEQGSESLYKSKIKRYSVEENHSDIEYFGLNTFP